MKDDERELLHKIRTAAFTNPFDPKRRAIDLSITGLSSAESIEKVHSQLLRRVSETTEAISARNRKAGVAPGREERELLHFGILFLVFHDFCDAYDDHIRAQVKAGDEILSVKFGREALAVLTESGISGQEAIRYFSLFFQMRRAFFFISGIAGASQCVMALRRSLWNNIFTSDSRIYDEFLWNRMEDFSTMILGETGTGKGMAAAAIGRSGYIPFDSKRSQFSESFARAFTPINLSQYPEQLIESELFGHRKGAFTGAIETHEGVFSRCSPCGAIFLDEIGDVSVPVQIKLLQVLQDRTFTPVGSHREKKFQGRVIAATNKSLDKIRASSQFRDDFYYRICSDVIHVPPLRQRLQEHPGELSEILQITVRRILGTRSPQAVEKIRLYISENQPPGYPWPGNIRELEQCVRRIMLSDHYHWQNFGEDEGKSDQFIHEVEAGTLTGRELLSQYCRRLYRKLGTYEAVSQQTALDRRTVKKYVTTAY